MRNVLILILMFFCWGNIIAELSVKSFRLLENDLDASVNYPMKDQNGDSCAIIKVKTNQKGFSFDGGITGIVKTIEKPSEIWLYVPWGLKRLSVFHPQLGQLKDCFLPVPLEKACVYELVLLSGKVDYTVEEGIINQSVAATIPADSIEEKKSFVVVESMPSFPGGNPALFKYLSENIKYPKKAMKKGIQGRVICQFIVNRDGSIVDVQVVRGVHELLDAEAVRVISNMPRWTPGRQRGKVVRVKYTLPVNFGLRKKSSTSN